MTDLIETCPFCHQECALPAALREMENWPVICHACDMMFEANQKQSLSAPSSEQAAIADKQADFICQTSYLEPYQCVHCHYQMTINRAELDRLISAKIALSCPNCREALLIEDARAHRSGLTTALIIFIFLTITASLWLVFTPEGEALRRAIQPYLATPYHFIDELRLAFKDLISFIRGLFLHL